MITRMSENPMVKKPLKKLNPKKQKPINKIDQDSWDKIQINLIREMSNSILNHHDDWFENAAGYLQHRPSSVFVAKYINFGKYVIQIQKINGSLSSDLALTDAISLTDAIRLNPAAGDTNSDLLKEAIHLSESWERWLKEEKEKIKERHRHKKAELAQQVLLLLKKS